MGRWSRHPMGSDRVQDVRLEFLEAVFELNNHTYDEMDNLYNKNEQEYYVICKEILSKLTLKQLREISNDEFIKDNKFVIPYVFTEYEAIPIDLKAHEFLKGCLDSHDITGEWNYCSETDSNGEILELKELRLFKEHFDDIINGKMEISQDKGLFAAMFSEEDRLINKF